MKKCHNCDTMEHSGNCNWLDWMVEEAHGCPHCAGPVTEIPNITAAGRLMDSIR